MITREYHLHRRPIGLPSAADFSLVSRELPPLGAGEVRVRNLFLSVDPYMRGRMSDARSYAAPYEIGVAMAGAAIGRVEESRHPDFAAGDLVRSFRGWREGFVSDARGLTRVDPTLAPPTAWLGVLGVPGFTAYVGLFDIGGLRGGETVLVSGAAGAVGATACQIAAIQGCRVIGVVGSDAKARWLEANAGVGATINYVTAGDLRAAIAAAAPDEVDLTFENVGGKHLEAALACSKPFGRIVVCGLIADYNAVEAPGGIRNGREILTRRLTVRGFIVSDHQRRESDFVRDMSGWIREGRIRWTETVVEGFERMPEAFIGLFEGRNTGKMVVKLSA